MVNKKLLLTVLFVAAVFLVGISGVCLAQFADNTGINESDSYMRKTTADQQGRSEEYREINERDTSMRNITADQQGQSKEDREITQMIRQAVVDDKSLSTYARNVKIITVDGMVTLRGPVGSAEEKNTIEEKAARVVGKTNVRNGIDIASKKTDR